MSEERDYAMRVLSDMGWEHRRIGRLFGLAGTTVTRALDRLPPASQAEIDDSDPLTPEEITELLDEYAADPTLSAGEAALAIDFIEGQRATAQCKRKRIPTSEGFAPFRISRRG